MRARTFEYQLEHIPYSEVRNSIVETWDGTLISGFKLQPFDIECSDEAHIGEISQTLTRILNSLSSDFSYSFVTAQVGESELFKKEFTIWIQRSTSSLSKNSYLKTNKLITMLGIVEKQANHELQEGVDRLKAILQSSGIGFSQLFGKELVCQLNRFFKSNGTSESFSSADLIIQENYFHFDHTYWGIVSVSEFPDQISIGQMNEIFASNSSSIMVLKVIPQASDKMIEQLKRRRKVSASLSVTNSRLRDMESEAKLQSEDELLETLIVGQEKVFNCQLSAIVNGETVKSVEIGLREITDKFKSFGYQMSREAVSLYPVFQSCLPGNEIEKNRAFLLPSSCVQALVSIFDIDPGHPNKIIQYLNRFGGQVAIDPWDSSLTSYNTVISGTSGSGKSFLSNILLRRLVEKEDPSIFIIDIGGSYRRQTILQGGQYITFDVNGKNGFNPLSGLSLNDPSSLEAAVDILCSIVGDARVGVGKYERNIILREVCEILSREQGEITLSILREAWSKSELAFLKNASTILYGWTGERTYGRLLDNTKRLETKARWVCFDLRGLNDHLELQRVVMLSVVKRLWDIVRYSDDKKILLLDEVWALIQNNSGFIGEVFRTFRKHNASAIAVTQSLEDIATETLTAAVLNNTPTKIVLKQSLRPERLQALLNLNSRELEIVRSLQSVKGEYSEFFMINGDKRRFLRLEPTPEDYWISTTNPQDLDFIKTFMNSHPELTELQSCHQIAKLYGSE